MQALQDHFSSFDEDDGNEDENGGGGGDDEQIWHLGFRELGLMNVHLEQAHEEAIDLGEIEDGIRVFLGFLKREGNERVWPLISPVPSLPPISEDRTQEIVPQAFSIGQQIQPILLSRS